MHKSTKLSYLNIVVLCLILALTVTGCATAGRIGNLPVIPEGAPTAEIVLIRPSNFVGAANSYYVALDGQDVFSIRSGQYTKLKIPAGDHFVAVKCFGGWTPTWKEDSKPAKASAGETLYFKISPNMSCADIEQVATEVGKQLLSNATFVSPETPSSKS